MLNKWFKRQKKEKVVQETNQISSVNTGSPRDAVKYMAKKKKEWL